MKRQKSAVVIGHNVGFTFADGHRLFSGLEFAFQPGKHGVVGNNGVGKSILAKLIAGELSPTEGSIARSVSSERILHLPQSLGSDPSATIADELGIGRELKAKKRIEEGAVDHELFEILAEAWDVEERGRAALAGIGLEHSGLFDEVSGLSPGERMRVRLARVRLSAPELLILDEPTNHLDVAASQMLYDFVGGFPGAIVVVSQDKRLLQQVSQIWELSDLGLRSYGGNFDFYHRVRVRELVAANEKVAKAQKELDARKSLAEEVSARQIARIEHGRKFVDPGLPKVHRGNMKRKSQETFGKIKHRHESRIEDAEERVRQALEAQSRAQLLDLGGGMFEPTRARVLVEAHDLNFERPYGRSDLWSGDLSFLLRSGERLAIEGANGAGKTTLLRAIQGLPVPFVQKGTLQVRAKVLAALDQELALFNTPESLMQVFRSAVPGLHDEEREKALSRSLFSQERIHMPCRTLSGGERVRAGIALALAQRPEPELLILDEPNNDLDSDSLAQIERALAELRCAMLVVSHDQEFLAALGVGQSIVLEPARGRDFARI